MKHFLPVIAGLTLLASGFASCSSDDEPEKKQNFENLTPGLYVTTVDSISFDPIKVDDHLYIDKYGGFFARGINVFPSNTPVEAETWTVDSMTWTEIESVIKVPRPSKLTHYATSPWEDDTTFQVTYWLWVERIKPKKNPSLRPMVVKIDTTATLYPRDIKLYLSQKPYSCVYNITQFGLNNNYIQIQGRTVDADTLPSVEMKAVRRPDGTFEVTRR